MTGELPYEVGAVATVRKVMLSLELLILVRDSSRERLQDRLSIFAPVPSLENTHPLRELVDPPGDLLAIGAGRKALDELADLAWIEPPAISQQEDRPAAARK